MPLGNGEIGLQEMLMQTNGREILLLPAWPKDWEADFKLHAPYETTVEGPGCEGQAGRPESDSGEPKGGCHSQRQPVISWFETSRSFRRGYGIWSTFTLNLG